MPVFTSSIEVTADYPTIKPSLNLNFARARALDPRITFTRASVGTYVGRDGLVKTAGEDEPRFDHDPDTLESLGLLIEESRTNNALYSDDFNNGAWVKQTSHGLTSNTTIAPDGTQNADTFNRGASNQYIYQSIGVTGTHTLSVWVKTPSGDGNHNFVMQHFNSTDGGLGNTTFTATEEWQRFNIQASPTVTGGWYPCIPSTLGQDMHVWGAQLEAGSFPTSYIPTSGNSVTRQIDNAYILNDNVPIRTGVGEYSFYLRGRLLTTAPLTGISRGLVGMGDSTSNRIRIPHDSQGAVEIYSGNSLQVSFNTGSFGTVERKVALAVKKDDFALSLDGGTVLTDTSGNIPVDIDTIALGCSTYDAPPITNPSTCYIKEFRIYPKRLTDAQLQLLTS